MMRQLKISKQLTDPAWEAEDVTALPFLRQLAAARPLGLEPTDDGWLRYICSVATLHRGQGASWEALLTAGYTALADCYERHAAIRPDFADTTAEYERRHSPNRWAAWWVQQGILKVINVEQVSGS